MVEDPPDGSSRALVLAAGMWPQIDVTEHEGAEREHRLADLLALHDVAGGLGRLDEVVHQRVDSTRAGLAEQCHLVLEKILGPQDPEAYGIVDVMVDVRDAVDDPNDLPLVRRGLALPGVRQDPVFDFRGEIEVLRDAERLLVVPEPAAESLRERLVERLLARMAERRMTHVVTEADRLDEVFVQAEGARDAAGNRGCLERVRHSGAVVVAGGIDEDLRFSFQAPERLRVEDPVAVALERRAQSALRLHASAPACLVRTDRVR